MTPPSTTGPTLPSSPVGRAVAGALTLALLALATAACGNGARPDALPESPAAKFAAQTEATAGPRVRPLPSPDELARSGAVVARDGADLKRLVDDPKGPAEIWLDDRTYATDLKIARKLALRGTGKSVIQGSSTATVVHIEADEVEIEDLIVRGAGGKHTTEDSGVKAKGKGVILRRIWSDRNLFGISLQMCAACQVISSRVSDVPSAGGDHGVTELKGDGIKLWEASDSVVKDCLVEDSRDVVVWYSRRVVLDGNVVRRSRYGTHFMYAHDSVVRHSRVVGNVVGIFVMYSARLHVEDNELAGAGGAAGVGLGFKDSDSVEVRGNWLVGNTTGVYLDRSPTVASRAVILADNVVALNDVALRLHATQQGVLLQGNDFHRNAVTVEVDGGGDALGLNLQGNHWSDYAGYDLDHDGIGDVAFEIKKLSSDLTEAHPELKLLQGTLALGLVDAVAHALPVFATQKILVDPAPAMDPAPLLGRRHARAAIPEKP